MDVGGCLAGGRSYCPQVLGCFVEVACMISRSGDWRGGSQRCAPARRRITEGLVRERIKLTALHIPLKLLVPRVGVELLKPRAELA